MRLNLCPGKAIDYGGLLLYCFFRGYSVVNVSVSGIKIFNRSLSKKNTKNSLIYEGFLGWIKM